MIGNAFIPHRTRDYDEMPHGDIFVEHTTSATGDELPTAKGNRLFQHTRGDGRANARMEKCQPSISILDLINAMRTIFPAILYHDFRIVPRNDFFDHFLKETDHAVFRQVARLYDL